MRSLDSGVKHVGLAYMLNVCIFSGIKKNSSADNYKVQCRALNGNCFLNEFLTHLSKNKTC